MSYKDIKYNFPGLNKSSPDHPMAVRISNGEEFSGTESEIMLQTQARSMAALEQLVVEQQITNLHLAKLTGEHYTELDIETKG